MGRCIHDNCLIVLIQKHSIASAGSAFPERLPAGSGSRPDGLPPPFPATPFCAGNHATDSYLAEQAGRPDRERMDQRFSRRADLQRLAALHAGRGPGVRRPLPDGGARHHRRPAGRRRAVPVPAEAAGEAGHHPAHHRLARRGGRLSVADGAGPAPRDLGALDRLRRPVAAGHRHLRRDPRRRAAAPGVLAVLDPGQPLRGRLRADPGRASVEATC